MSRGTSLISQVSWANASLRYPEELPELSAPGRGVVREDPLAAGFSAHATLSPRAARSPRSPLSDRSESFVSANSNGSGAHESPSPGSRAGHHGSGNLGALKECAVCWASQRHLHPDGRGRAGCVALT